MTDASGKTPVELTASIVSAYLSNNPTQASEIPNLISQVHAALLRVSSGRADTPLEPAKPAVSVKKSITSGISGLSRGRQALQVAEAPSAHAVQHDAGAIPRQMGPAAGLSDGRAELRGGALAARQEDGPRPAGAEKDGSNLAGSGDLRTPRRAPRAHRSGCARPSSAGRWSAAASDARESRTRRTRRAHRSPGSRCGVWPEYSVSRIAIRPRTIWASLSPR